MSKLFFDIMQGFKEFAEITHNEDLKSKIDTQIEEVREETSTLKEDATGAEEDSTPNPPTLEHMGVATLINSLIQDEWQAIQGYNDAVATLASEGISEDIIAVFKDIVDEENIHVGQLQKALETVSPNAESISKGEKEGEEQLQAPVTPGEASL